MDLFLCVPNIIIFLIPLLPSSSAKISFCNTLLISKKTFHFTTKIPIALCWSIDIETLILTLLTRSVKPCRILGKSFTKNIPATTRVWSKISYGDEWTSSQAFSYFLCIFSGKTFFFLTSWKYKRVPIWLKTLNPEEYAAKYWYWKGLDVYALAKREWDKCKKKTFAA